MGGKHTAPAGSGPEAAAHEVEAVCRGPAALLDVILSDGSGFLDGQQFAAFTDREEDRWKPDVPFMVDAALERQGARHAAIEEFNSARCVTPRG